MLLGESWVSAYGQCTVQTRLTDKLPSHLLFQFCLLWGSILGAVVRRTESTNGLSLHSLGFVVKINVVLAWADCNVGGFWFGSSW